jgi:hypothetical protein
LLCSCCACSCCWGVISQNTAVFANFDQFHHASPAVGRQHIASFITGLFSILGQTTTTTRLPQEWREYVSGWGAAVCNIFATFPLNKTMFRQQVHGFTTSEAMKQLKKEGGVYLYRGILPPLLQKSSSSAIMFGTYSQYTRLLTNSSSFGKSNKKQKVS